MTQPLFFWWVCCVLGWKINSCHPGGHARASDLLAPPSKQHLLQWLLVTGSDVPSNLEMQGSSASSLGGRSCFFSIFIESVLWLRSWMRLWFCFTTLQIYKSLCWAGPAAQGTPTLPREYQAVIYHCLYINHVLGGFPAKIFPFGSSLRILGRSLSL